MDDKHHDKKRQTFLDRLRAVWTTTLRRSSSSHRKPGTPSNCSTYSATPSSSRSPSPVAAKQGLAREENKKIKHKGLKNWKRGEKSIQKPVNQPEQQMNTTENIIDQIRSRIEEQPDTIPVTPETVAVILPSNASETAESESYTSARSSESKLSRDRPNTQRKIRKKKQKDQVGSNLIESHRSIRTITISASSHKSEISQLHSEASSSEKLPGCFQASQLNVNVLEVPRVVGHTDESTLGQNTTPLAVVGFHIVVSSTYLPSADSADAPVSNNQTKVAASKSSTRGAKGNTNPLPGPPLESVCVRKPCTTTTKEAKKNPHNTTRIEYTRKQVHRSLQDTCAQRTTKPAVQSMRRLPTQSAMAPENRNMINKFPPYTKSVPEGKRSQSAARTNTSPHDPTDKFKTRVVLLKKKISNHKVIPTKNRQITTPPHKQQTGGQKTNVSNRCQSPSQPQNCHGIRNTKVQGPSKSKPNAFLPTDPSGSSMDRPRSGARNGNNSQVRPQTSRSGSSSRSTLLSESELNKPRVPMGSLVRPKTTLTNVRLPTGSLSSNTNKILSPVTKSSDARQEEALRRADYKRMELLFTNTRSSAVQPRTSSTLLHMHGTRQVTDRPCTSWCCSSAEIIAKPNLLTSTVRQTTSFPYTKAEHVERLPIDATTPLDNRIVIPVPLIRERTYLVLPSIKPLENDDTWDENFEAVTPVLRRENTFLIQPSFNFGRLIAKPKTKIKKTSTSTPMFTNNNKTYPAQLGPGRITSEILSKTESAIPLTNESTYLILPRTSISRRAESNNQALIPLKKKSTYVVISPWRSNSGLKVYRTTSKIPLLRSSTYQVIQSKKTHSMPNIG